MQLGRYQEFPIAQLNTWPALWSIALAAAPNTFPNLYMFGLYYIGSYLMRSTGCIINDMIDRDLDRQVERTKSRPLVTNQITMKQAFGFLAVNISLGLILLSALNLKTAIYAFACFPLVVLYPFCKRFMNHPQFVLSLPASFGALMGYTSVTNTWDLAVTAPLFAGTCSWVIFYDSIYSHQDKKDDIKAGIKSTALTWGDDSKYFMKLFFKLSLFGWAVSGFIADLNWFYFATIGLNAYLMKKQIVKLNLDTPEKCFKAFVGNNWYGLILLIGIVIGKFDAFRFIPKKQKNEKKEIQEREQNNN